ncbi:MAG: aldo/keto reductase [Betaproteobacteria bacterium]|nr:aldo/keto reductase [Betaproteobacteria bacterium]MSQ87683.1 aldo/keto reductase [Betaproteobacteria bacterium]
MDEAWRAVLRLLAGFGATLALGSAAAQTPKIMTRKIPATGEDLPAIGLGTWQVFDVGNDPAARTPLRKVIAGFAKAGGKMIDSSPMYGSAESVAGDLVAELGLRDQTFIATKVWTRGREDGIKQMATSFRRLKVQQMDLMQIHNLLDVAIHTPTINDMKAQGRVRYTGITHHTSSAYAEVEKWLKAEQYDFLQINYSLAERESEQRLLALCRDKNIAVIANRPFAEGAMFRRVRGKPLPPWAAEIGAASWAQYFLKWIVSHPAITCAIPGTAKPEHIADNVAAGFGALPDAAMRRRMAEHFDSL